MTVRNLVLVMLVAVLLEACGDAQRTSNNQRQPTRAELEAALKEAEPIIKEELAKADARSAVRFPCTLYSREESSALLGTELEAPTYAFENKNYGNETMKAAWRADACTWATFGEGPTLMLWVSRPEHFDDGKVQCVGISPDDATEQLLGGEAVWTFRRRYAWAELLACRDDALFHLELHDGPTDEPAARELILKIAAHVVESLPTASPAKATGEKS